MNRTGTKWLSNILCNHHEIAGVQSQRHRGILETNMFGVMESKFALDSLDDYAAMIELWSQSDFFRLTGIDKQLIIDEFPHPTESVKLFGKLMDELACSRGCSFWLQKTDPASAIKIIEHFPSAQFIVIRRKIIDTIQSMIELDRLNNNQLPLSRAVFSYMQQDKMLARIQRVEYARSVSYEQLRLHPATVIRGLCDSLRIDFSDDLLNIPFLKNSSFRGDESKRKKFGPFQHCIVRCLQGILWPVPLSMINLAVKIKRLFRKSAPEKFVSGSFGSLKDQLTQTASMETVQKK